MGGASWECQLQVWMLLIVSTWPVMQQLKYIYQDTAFVQALEGYTIPVGIIATTVVAYAGIRWMSEAGTELCFTTQMPSQPLDDARQECESLRRVMAGLEEQLLQQREQLNKAEQELRALGLEADTLRSRCQHEKRERQRAESAADDLQAQLDLVEGHYGCGPLFSVAHLSPSDAAERSHKASPSRSLSLSEGQSFHAEAGEASAWARSACSAAGDAAQLQRQVSELRSALAQRDVHRGEVERLREEHVREVAARRKAEEQLRAVMAEAGRMRARCREAEEMAATTSEVADALKDRLIELSTQASQDAAALAAFQTRCERLTAARLDEVGTVQEVEELEHEVRGSLSLSLELLAKRRTEIQVQEAVRRNSEAEASGVPLCRICYEREIECALLPCKHHSFCKQCARHIVRTYRKCPFCRQPATDLFETFLG